MDWSRESVIVIGGGGFLGHHIINALMLRNCGQIAVFSRRPAPDLEKQGVRVIGGDIREADAVSRACAGRTVVFHTAAKAGVWGRRRDYYSINVNGTENVLEACRRNAVHTLIYTSSPSVAYSPSTNVEGDDESLPYPERYLACYPETKALAEKKALGVFNKELSVAALRPHLLWGPGDPHLLPRFIAAAKTRRLAQVGNGENRVDLTHVANAAAAHLLAAETLRREKRCRRKVYFISDGAPVKLWPWLNTLLARLLLPPIEKTISYEKAFRLGAVLEKVYTALPFLGDPPMTRFVAGQLAFSHYFNITAAVNELGYQPVITPETAMEQTLEWLRQNGAAE